MQIHTDEALQHSALNGGRWSYFLEDSEGNTLREVLDVLPHEAPHGEEYVEIDGDMVRGFWHPFEI